MPAPPPAEDDDRDDVQLAQSGDFDAFERLVYRHQQGVFRLAARIVGNDADAQEVVQDTFLSALQHLREFRGEARFLTWLTRIATNHALKMLRRSRYEATPSPARPGSARVTSADTYAGLPHPEFIAPWSETPDQIVARQETRQLLDAAIAELDEKYRLVFLLRDVQELSTRETALSLGVTEANVKVRLLRARLQLRERLTRQLGDPARRVVPDHDH